MMSCREVGELVAGDGLEGAGWGQRLRVRLHLLMCRHCRRYARQLRAIGACARERWGHPPQDPVTLQRLELAILKGFPGHPKGDPEKSAKPDKS